MSAVDDVRTYLTNQSLVGGGTGWTCLRRRFLDDVNKLVVVTEDGGPDPEIKVATGVGSASIEDIGVLVTVRGESWDSDATASKAQAILDALHGLLDTTLGARKYIRVKALTGEPVFVGFDDTGRPLHTVAFRLLANVGN